MFQRPHNTKIEHNNEQNHPAQRNCESSNCRDSGPQEQDPLPLFLSLTLEKFSTTQIKA
jgi:hypothetical protein